MTVTSAAAMVLHKKFGEPSLHIAMSGFWGTLYGECGLLRLARHGETVAVISDIEHIGTDLVDTGRGIFLLGLVVITGGEKLPLLPFERPGFLPHPSKDPAAVAAEIRATVFGAA